jgi:hypothetical protein
MTLMSRMTARLGAERGAEKLGIQFANGVGYSSPI